MLNNQDVFSVKELFDEYEKDYSVAKRWMPVIKFFLSEAIKWSRLCLYTEDLYTTHISHCLKSFNFSPKNAYEILDNLLIGRRQLHKFLHILGFPSDHDGSSNVDKKWLGKYQKIMRNKQWAYSLLEDPKRPIKREDVAYLIAGKFPGSNRMPKVVKSILEFLPPGKKLNPFEAIKLYTDQFGCNELPLKHSQEMSYPFVEGLPLLKADYNTVNFEHIGYDWVKAFLPEWGKFASEVDVLFSIFQKNVKVYLFLSDEEKTEQELEEGSETFLELEPIVARELLLVSQLTSVSCLNGRRLKIGKKRKAIHFLDLVSTPNDVEECKRIERINLPNDPYLTRTEQEKSSPAPKRLNMQQVLNLPFFKGFSEDDILELANQGLFGVYFKDTSRRVKPFRALWGSQPKDKEWLRKTPRLLRLRATNGVERDKTLTDDKTQYFGSIADLIDHNEIRLTFSKDMVVLGNSQEEEMYNIRFSLHGPKLLNRPDVVISIENLVFLENELFKIEQKMRLERGLNLEQELSDEDSKFVIGEEQVVPVKQPNTHLLLELIEELIREHGFSKSKQLWVYFEQNQYAYSCIDDVDSWESDNPKIYWTSHLGNIDDMQRNSFQTRFCEINKRVKNKDS